ncbi:MAG: hypothetical protein DRP11_04975, partial [Candidatus Aenigmatarchaeota archaeon]
MKSLIYSLVLIKALNYAQVTYIYLHTTPVHKQTLSSLVRELVTYQDGRSYIRICETGYEFEREHFPNYAFFPGFPILLKLLAFVTGSAIFFLSAILVLNFTLSIIGAAILWSVLRGDYDEGVSFWALVFLMSSPRALYFDMAYAESFYLFMTAVILRFSISAKIAPGVVCGFLGGIIRPQGLALSSLGLFCPQGTWIRRLIFAAAPIFGFFGYASYVWLNTGNPLEVITVQEHWGRTFGIGNILSTGNLLDRIYLVLGFVCVGIGWKYLLKRDWLFLVTSLCIPLLTGSLMSLSRFCL